MRVVRAVLRHKGTLNQSSLFQRGEQLVISPPDGKASSSDFSRVLELGHQEGGGKLPRQEGRADVLPGVFVDFAAVEAAAVGTFFAQDLRALAQAALVHKQAA